MILQRVFAFILSALNWLIETMLPRVVVIALLLVLGLGLLFVLVGWRGRARVLAQPKRRPPPHA